jgi:hypothetical protein
MNTPIGEKALSDRELYYKIVEHRRKFYHVSYADYYKDYPPYITIVPPDSCRIAWKQDYQELQKNFIYGTSLEFEELLKRIEILQQQMRNVSELTI